MATPQQPRDHSIPLDEAARLTAAYRKSHPEAVRAFAFDRAAYDAILRQDGCVRVRTYLGQHDDGSLTCVLVGIDAKGEDMTAGALMQDPDYCPINCPVDSPLDAQG